jgi:hypothetical protein
LSGLPRGQLDARQQGKRGGDEVCLMEKKETGRAKWFLAAVSRSGGSRYIYIIPGSQAGDILAQVGLRASELPAVWFRLPKPVKISTRPNFSCSIDAQEWTMATYFSAPWPTRLRHFPVVGLLLGMMTLGLSSTSSLGLAASHEAARGSRPGTSGGPWSQSTGRWDRGCRTLSPPALRSIVPKCPVRACNLGCGFTHPPASIKSDGLLA